MELGVNELDAFKRVLQAISDIRNILVDAELIFRDVEERHHTLRLQGIQVLLFYYIYEDRAKAESVSIILLFIIYYTLINFNFIITKNCISPKSLWVLT